MVYKSKKKGKAAIGLDKGTGVGKTMPAQPNLKSAKTAPKMMAINKSGKTKKKK